MPEKMSEYSGFIHLPNWTEPFGRVVMEAYLSGCELIVNDKIGAMSFDWDYSDYDEVKDKLQSSVKKFWQVVESYL
jgi:hypothetical protein